jgi:NAD(P)-dependent dehydrogenase (short-subunit alcohol dehydrogenase family)
LGRAYALLLAARGAAVVVNDLGGSVDGTGTSTEPAAAVVEEITAAGGRAMASGHDVSSAEDAAALVTGAVESYGRVDVVINNAGIMRWAGFPNVAAEDLAAHFAVHVAGSFNVTQAAWPYMTTAGYGRVVMTTSAGMLGLWNNTSYATAKAGVVGLVRSLAVAGRRHGIHVNGVAPAAATRMGGDSAAGGLEPSQVAPMVAYLSHETCPATGDLFAAGGGRFARLFVASTPGWVGPASATAEDVAVHWSAITDETGYWIPADLLDWSTRFLG